MKKKGLFIISALCLTGATGAWYLLNRNFDQVSFYENLKNKKFDEASQLLQKEKKYLTEIDQLILSTELSILKGDLSQAADSLILLEKAVTSTDLQNTYGNDLFLLRIALNTQKNNRTEVNSLLAAQNSLCPTLNPYYKHFFEGLFVKDQNPFEAINHWNQMHENYDNKTARALIFETSFPISYRKKLFIEALLNTKASPQIDEAALLLQQTTFALQDTSSLAELAINCITQKDSTAPLETRISNSFSLLQALQKNNPQLNQDTICQALYFKGVDSIHEEHALEFSLMLQLLKKYQSPQETALFTKLKEELANSDRAQNKHSSLIDTMVSLSSPEEKEAIVSFFLKESLDCFLVNNFARAHYFIIACRKINPNISCKDLQNVVSESILLNIRDSNIQEKLAFYAFIASKEEYESLSTTLVEETFTLWDDPAVRPQIYAVWKALHTVALSSALKEKITSFLELHYKTATNVDDLTALIAAEKTINSTFIIEQEKKKVSEHIQKARTAFNSMNYEESLKESSFASSFGTTDELKVLQALAYYGLNNLKKASEIVNTIQTPGKEVTQLKALVKILLAPEDARKELIHEALAAHEIDGDTLLLCGVKELQKTHYFNAFTFFESLESNPLSSALLACTNLLSGNIEKAYTQLSALPEKMQNDPHIRTALLVSATECARVRDATAIANKTISSCEELFPASISTVLSSIPELNNDFAMSLYYLNIIGDPILALDHCKECPQSLRTALTKADIFIALEEYTAAKAALKDVLHERSAQCLLCKLYLNEDNPLKAYTTFKKLQEQQPFSIEEKKEYAKILLALGLYSEAKNEYTSLENSISFSAQDTLDFIQAQITFKNRQKAISLGKQLLEKELPLYLEVRLVRLMMQAQARISLEPLFQQLPTSLSPMALYEVTTLLQELGQYDAATSLLKDNETTVNKSPALALRKIEILRRNGSLAQAIELAQAVITKNPTYAKATSFLRRYNSDPVFLKEQMKILSEDVRQSPQYPDIISGLEFLLSLDAKERKATNLDQREIIYGINRYLSLMSKMAHEVNKPIPYFLYLQGAVASSENNKEQAQEYYLKALEENPSFSKALIQKGLSLMNAQKYFDAKKTFTEALFFDQDNAFYWYLAAMSCRRAGDLFAAKDCYKQAIRFEPKNTTYLVKTAEFLMTLKNPEEASIYLQRALAINEKDLTTLKLYFAVLLDPQIIATLPKEKLTAERQAILERINEIDPKEAEQLRAKI